MSIKSVKRFPVNGDFSTMLSNMKEYKKSIRNLLPDCKIQFAARGRGKRKEVFAITGRPYYSTFANGNDVYINQREAPLMSEFVLYTYIREKV